MTEWEEIEVPRGSFVSWGERAGQHVTGRVVSYSETDGTDFNENPCPQLGVELTERAASIDKSGNRTDIDAGELVLLNCGQVSLKRAVRAAALNPGDLVRIELTGLEKVARGTVKTFSIRVARGAGVGSGTGSSTGAATAPSSSPAEEEPPF